MVISRGSQDGIRVAAVTNISRHHTGVAGLVTLLSRTGVSAGLAGARIARLFSVAEVNVRTVLIGLALGITDADPVFADLTRSAVNGCS